MSGVVMKNERPVMVEPWPTELVPTPVFVKCGKEYKSLSLGMNSPTEPWRRPSGSVVDLLAEKDGKYTSYAKVQLPEGKEDVTIFMLRNQQSQDWQKEPYVMVFKNGIETFPLGSVRLINFSSVPLAVTIGDAKNIISPKSVKIFPNPGTKSESVLFAYQISARINGAVQSLANTAISYDKKSRINFLVYDRDGKSEVKLEGDDQPVKVVKYFELPYTSPDGPETPKSAVSGTGPP